MAIPEGVKRLIEAYAKAARECVDYDGASLWQQACYLGARAALVQAIEQAVVDAEVRVFQEHCGHLWNTDTGFCIHCGAPKP